MRNKVANILLGPDLVSRGIEWQGGAPSASAKGALIGDVPISSGEAIMVEAAFAIGSGGGNGWIGRAIARLDAEHLRKLGSLLMAFGDATDRNAAVERWVAAGGGA